jgi:hypothetical protein
MSTAIALAARSYGVGFMLSWPRRRSISAALQSRWSFARAQSVGTPQDALAKDYGWGKWTFSGPFLIEQMWQPEAVFAVSIFFMTPKSYAESGFAPFCWVCGARHNGQRTWLSVGPLRLSSYLLPDGPALE